MRFEEALGALREGKKVRRASWDKHYRHVELKTNGGFTEAFVFKDTTGGETMEWPYAAARRSDLLAEDWELVE